MISDQVVIMTRAEWEAERREVWAAGYKARGLALPIAVHIEAIIVRWQVRSTENWQRSAAQEIAQAWAASELAVETIAES